MNTAINNAIELYSYTISYKQVLGQMERIVENTKIIARIKYFKPMALAAAIPIYNAE